MKHTTYKGIIKKQSTSGDFLKTRLSINSKYSKNNLIEWQSNKIKFNKASDVLDLGCGNGAQAKFLINRITQDKTLTCVDLSKKSLGLLKKSIKNKNLKIINMNMDDLPLKYNDSFDILHSSYALYYSSNPKKLLDHCYKLLNPNGKFIVTVPCYPHTLVEEIDNIKKIPKNVHESLKFYENFLKKYFENKFSKIKIHNFKNILEINEEKDLIKLYESTTYYDKNNCSELIKIFRHNMNKSGVFKLRKNAKLLIGSK